MGFSSFGHRYNFPRLPKTSSGQTPIFISRPPISVGVYPEENLPRGAIGSLTLERGFVRHFMIESLAQKFTCVRLFFNTISVGLLSLFPEVPSPPLSSFSLWLALAAPFSPGRPQLFLCRVVIPSPNRSLRNWF